MLSSTEIKNPIHAPAPFGSLGRVKRYKKKKKKNFIHSTWLLVRRSDDLCKQNYYWSDGNIVDQKIYTWFYVWLGINSSCYYKVFDFSLNKSR